MAAVTKAPPYPKQKYNDIKFREIMPQLTLVEYLKIEYISKGVWYKMISKRGNMYNCECCSIDNVGPKPIIEHIRGKKHRIAMQTAEKLYHPNYTAPKNSSAPARTPILDAYNGAVGTLPPKQAKLVNDTTAQKTPAQKAATTPAQKTSTTPAQKATTTPSQKATTTPSQKATTTPSQKAGVQKKPPTGPQQSKPAVKKPNESAQANAAAKTKAPAIESEEKPSAKTDSVSKANVPASNTTESPLAQPQAKDTTKPAESSAENAQTRDDSEIVILDDDDEDMSQVKAEPAKSLLPVVISTPETAKPQRVPKRPITGPETATNGSEANAAAPSKKVINPAAVLAKSSEKNLENVPRYQQNRVIIPTADKAKKKPSPVVKSQQESSASTPTFSSKTFSTTSNDIEGIIGVEYVVKILKVYNDPEPFYECCLCEVVMDGIGMQTHLLGYNHRYKYIEKHFPTCFGQYKDHIGNIQVMGIILDRIAKAIESHHGRELPYECLSGEFRSNRHGVMTTVYSFRHASEYSGPSFTNVVDTKQIDEFYKQKNVYLPPKPDPKRKPTFDTRVGSTKSKIDPKRKTELEGRVGGPDTKRSRLDRRGNGGSNGTSSRRPYRDEMETNIVDDAVHKQMVEEFLQKNRGRSRSPGNRRRRHRSRSKSGSPHRSSRRKEQRRSLSPLRDGDIWQAYRHMVDRYKTELDQTYRDYRKDPEKHPLYDEEWRKFWKHRKEQMTREGLDHRNYDFQPEWVRYFAVRIEELYDEQMEEIKVTSRRRLFLPMTNDDLEDEKYHVTIHEPTMEQVEMKPEPMYSQTRDNKTSVVNVLRLLTALEDYLGSLGPRVVDLLSKALLVEKSNPRDINEIVLTIENCTVLETAMEKLRGVLIAGLLEGPKVRAFNNVIFETEKILKIAYKMKPRNPQPVQPPQIVPAPRSQQDYLKSSWLTAGGSGNSFIPSPQSNLMAGGTTGAPSIGAAATFLSQIDKKELASKLAAALTAQGKTDFNPEQLQQLIAVYTLIDKKKRDSAAAADKHKMTLSDTLKALLKVTEKSVSADVALPSSSGRFGGGNYSNSSNERVTDRPGSLSNSSISNFVSMLNRDNSSSSGDSQLWQNLQNIQNSLRTQNAMGASKNSGSLGGNSGGFLNNMPSGGNYKRVGYSGTDSGSGGGVGNSNFDLGQNSSSGMNFNRGGGGAGYNSNFSSMNSGSSGGLSRGNGGGGRELANEDDMLESGRGGGGMGGNFSSGGMRSGSNNFSRSSIGIGGGGGNSGFSTSGNDTFLSGVGKSGGNSSGFGGGFSGNSGMSNFSSLGGNNNNFQRGGGNGGGNSGMVMGGGNNNGLGMNGGGGNNNFSRGGASSNSMMGNFNKPFVSGQRNDGGNQGFGSNMRNTGGNQPNRNSNVPMGSNGNNSQNQGNNRGGGGSNWRNQ